MSAPDQLRSKISPRYLVERELGRGGMGTVFLARDIQLDRPVALKVLPAELAAMPALGERFLRETRTAASFSHPNIVPVYAVEEGDDLLAYAMAYVEGESLADRVKRGGPLGARELVKLLQDAAYALAYAHGRGVGQSVASSCNSPVVGRGTAWRRAGHQPIRGAVPGRDRPPRPLRQCAREALTCPSARMSESRRSKHAWRSSNGGEGSPERDSSETAARRSPILFTESVIPSERSESRDLLDFEFRRRGVVDRYASRSAHPILRDPSTSRCALRSG